MVISGSHNLQETLNIKSQGNIDDQSYIKYSFEKFAIFLYK
jgi:hypothetical protein